MNRLQLALRCATVLSLLPVAAVAQAVPVREILGSGDPMPTGPGAVNGLSTPTIDGGMLAYQALSDQSYKAVLLQSATGGTTTTVVDNQASMPNSNATFWSLGVPRVRAGTALVYGRDLPLIDQGLYFGSGAALSVFADRATTSFSGFNSSNYSFDGQNVAFYAVDPVAGLFLGSLGSNSYQVIVRGNDALPGDPTARINQIHAPSLAGGWLVFSVRVYDTQTFQLSYAVLRYELASQTLTTVVARQAQVPAIGGAFTLIQGATTDGTSIVFAGSQGNHLFGGWNGLCRWRNGVLTTIVDNTTALPGSNQPAPIFGAANSGWRAHGDDVVFSCGDGIQGQTMLYAWWRARFVRLAVQGDVLAGDTLDDLWFSQDGFDGRYVTFLGRHGLGGPVSIYVADLACANVESYGNGCGPVAATPALRSTGCPTGGEAFTLEADGCVGPVALAAFGSGRVQVPFFGCELLVGPLQFTATAAVQNGAASFPLGVLPAGLSGVRLTVQVLSVDAITSALASTNGLDITVL